MLKLPKKAISINNNSAQGTAIKVAKYYKEEEKHLQLDELDNSKDVDGDYADYIKGDNLAEKSQSSEKEKLQLSEWGGTLAQKAGIEGKEVTTEALAEAFEGKFLDQEIARRTDGTRRAGYDLVFSAPKSTSIMALLFKDERIIQAHLDSVKATMKEFAKTVPYMRITNPETKEVERVPSDQILYALETHKTSRHLDPQLHTHALLINMIMTDEGMLRALNIDTLYEGKLNLYFGKMYQANFNKLVRGLGYDTHAVGNGQFEISGIPKEFLESFSQRRAEIIKLVQQMGAKDVNTIDDITKFSRDPKRNVASTYLHKLWEDRKAEFDGEALKQAAMNKSAQAESMMQAGNGENSKNENSAISPSNTQHKDQTLQPQHDQILKEVKELKDNDSRSQDSVSKGEIEQGNKNNPVQNTGNQSDSTTARKTQELESADRNGGQGKLQPITADMIISLTIAHISRFQTKMDYNLVLSKALEDFAIEQGVDITDLQQALEGKIDKNEVVGLDKHSTTLTTAKQQQDELGIHDRLKNQVKNMKTVVNSEQLNALGLTKDNRQAIGSIFESSKQANMVNIQGNHKTLINSLVETAKHTDKRIKILSPNHYHLNDLARSTIANETDDDTKANKSFSLFEWLKDKLTDQKQDYKPLDTLGGFIYKQEKIIDAENNLKAGQTLKAKDKINAQDVIVVDQAEKLSIEDTKKLLDITQHNKAKVIFLNHEDAAFNAKNAGNIIETLQTGGIKNVNFSAQQQSQAKLDITEITNDDQRLSHIVSEYKKLSPIDRDNTLLVSSSKKEVKALNHALRDALIEQNELGKESLTLNMERRVYLTPEQKLSAKFFKQGERIDFFTKDKGLMSYEIKGIDTANNLVKTAKVEEKNTISGFFKNIVNDRTTKNETSFNPVTNKNDFALVKREAMELRQGDKVFVFNSATRLLNKGQSYQVQSFDSKHIALVDEHNQVSTLSHVQFEKCNMDYDYNRTLDYVSHNENKSIIANMKQYKLDKEVTSELLNKAQGDVILYTDNSKKAENRIQLSGIQPSSITSTLQAHFKDVVKPIEKYMSDDTRKLLTEDLATALIALKAEYSKDDLTKAVEHVIDVLSDRQAAFTHQELLEEATSHAMHSDNNAFSFDDVKNKLAELKASGKLLSDNSETMWTTKEAVDLERSIIQSATNGKEKVESLANEQQSSEYLNNLGGQLTESRQLTKGQQDAIKLITNTKDRFIAVQGYAGVGKSTMLQQAQKLVEHAKAISSKNGKSIEFVGLAPTHQAVEVLNSKNIDSHTAKSLLFEETANILASKDEDLSHKVFLLDESSMMSNKDFADFMNIIDKKNARAVFLGDIKQLESLEAGAPFKLLILGDKISTAVMKEIQRQKDPAYLKAVYELAKFNPELAYKFLDKQQGHSVIEYQDKRPSIALNIVEPEFTPKELAQIQELKPHKQTQAKVGKMLEMAAHEYLARTPETRENSIIVTNSHNERNHITEIIRHGLKDERAIGNGKDQTINIVQLVNLDKSENEMRSMDAYKEANILQKGQDKYFHIIDRDEQQKILTLKEIKTGKESHFSVARSNHRFNGLYKIENNELALNDKVVMRKTNKLKNMQANEKLVVQKIDIDTGNVTLGNDKGKSININANNLDELHWEHGYTSTTLGAQGDDRYLAISVDKSNSPLANPLSDYVKKSRGIKHVMSFTDDRNAYVSKLKQHYDGNKVALKVTGDVSLTEYFVRYAKENQHKKTQSSQKNNHQTKAEHAANSQHKASADTNKSNVIHLKSKPSNTNKSVKSNLTNATTNTQKADSKLSKYANTIIQEKVYDPRYLDSNGKFDIRKYGDEVGKELIKSTESVIKSLLGEPNPQHSNGSVAAYGRDSASLKVTLTGKYRGYWKDWATGERGNLISLIMRENKGYSYSDAVAEGAKMIAMPEAFSIKETKQHETLSKDIPLDKRKQKSFDRAVKIWEKAHPVKGTLAEKYLTQHRGITDFKDADIRFNTGVYSNEVKGNYQPALVARFTNSKGEFTGVESIYLDRKTANKMEKLQVGKRTNGIKNGSSVLTSKGNESSNNITLLAEGVVTALSVKQAFANEHILAAGGIENFANINPDLLKDNVILCADNDVKDLANDKIIIKAISTFEKAGKNVSVVMPELINNQKTDYNDILKSKGLDAIIENIKPTIDTIKSQENSIIKIVNQLIKDNKIAKDDVKGAMDYIRQTGDIDVKSIENHITDLHRNMPDLDINKLSKSVIDDALKFADQSKSDINSKVNNDIDIVKHDDHSQKIITQRTK